MPFQFPVIDIPVPLDDGRSWTATFDSYDERNMDLYYRITVQGSSGPDASFMACVFPYWAAPDAPWDTPDFTRSLRQALHEVAAGGCTNTNYGGRSAT